MKLARTNILQLTEDEKDYLDDLVVETSQALETANTYTNILSSSLDAFASIISNNQNEVLKRLTTLTIFLSIPVLIASIYGMNVPIPMPIHILHFGYLSTLALCILAFVIWNYWKRYKK
jgi:magnesium transporter